MEEVAHRLRRMRETAAENPVSSRTSTGRIKVEEVPVSSDDPSRTTHTRSRIR